MSDAKKRHSAESFNSENFRPSRMPDFQDTIIPPRPQGLPEDNPLETLEELRRQSRQ